MHFVNVECDKLKFFHVAPLNLFGLAWLVFHLFDLKFGIIITMKVKKFTGSMQSFLSLFVTVHETRDSQIG